MTVTDMISYRHKDDHQNKTRFLQYRKDKVPSWAVDVQPHIPHPLAAEARMALERDDVAGWIGSLPKTPLAEALAVPEVAALDEIRNLLVRDPDSRLFGISRETLEALAALRAIGERADG